MRMRWARANASTCAAGRPDSISSISFSCSATLPIARSGTNENADRRVVPSRIHSRLTMSRMWVFGHLQYSVSWNWWFICGEPAGSRFSTLRRMSSLMRRASTRSAGVRCGIANAVAAASSTASASTVSGYRLRSIEPTVAPMLRV